MGGEAAGGLIAAGFPQPESVNGIEQDPLEGVSNHFNGEVKGVLLSISDDPDNSGHLVKPEDALRAALGRQ
jgi:hypothetical protein